MDDDDYELYVADARPWELAQVQFGVPACVEMLREGWEPFHVTTLTVPTPPEVKILDPTAGATAQIPIVWMRRLAPIEAPPLPAEADPSLNSPPEGSS